MDQKTGETVSGWLLAVFGGMQLVLVLMVLAIVWLMCILFAGIGGYGAYLDSGAGGVVGAVLGMGAVGLFYTILLAPFGVLYGAALGSGVGLIRGKSWAVIAASISSVLILWIFPLGTAIGFGTLLMLWMPRMSESSPKTSLAPSSAG